MKKLFFTILTFILMLSTPAVVYAAPNNRYYIDDLSMSFVVPADYTTITRTMSEDDPTLTKIGSSSQEVKEMLESKDEHLEAWDENRDYSIAVYENGKMTSPICLNMWSEDSIRNLAAAMIVKSEYDPDYDLVDYEICLHPDLFYFIKFHCVYSDGRHEIQYYTIYYNTAITICMTSYHSEIDDDKEAEFESYFRDINCPTTMARMAVNGAEWAVNNTSTVSEYRNDFTAVELAVPITFIEAPDLKEETNTEIAYRFAGTTDVFFYNGGNAWANLPEETKRKIPMEEWDTACYSIEEISENTGEPLESISEEMYGGKLHYKITREGVVDVMLFEKGFVHEYYYVGDLNGEGFSEYEKIIEGAVYHERELPEEAIKYKEESEDYPEDLPEIDDSAKAEIDEESDDEESDEDESDSKKKPNGILIAVIAVAALGIIGGAAATFLNRSKNTDKTAAESKSFEKPTCEPVPEPKHEPIEEPTYEPIEEPKYEPAPEPKHEPAPEKEMPEIFYCIKCGRQLTSKHKFCPGCGWKIER